MGTAHTAVQTPLRKAKGTCGNPAGLAGGQRVVTAPSPRRPDLEAQPWGVLAKRRIESAAN